LFRWEALGLYIITSKLGVGRDPDSYLKAFFVEDFQKISAEWKNGFTPYLVYRSEDMYNRHLEWEKDIADNFIGQYFSSPMFSTVPDQTTCDAIIGRRVKLADSNPDFIGYSDSAIPGIQVHPYGNTLGKNVEAGVKFRKTIKRNAPWGGNFSADRDLDIKTFSPRFVTVTPEAYENLVSVGAVSGDVGSSFQVGGASFQMGILFVRNGLRDVVRVSPIVSAVNQNEVPDYVVNPRYDAKDTKHCTPKCSIDMATFICGADLLTGSSLQPAVQSKRAWGITVSVDSLELGDIVAPSGAVAGQVYNRIETINFMEFFGQKAILEMERSIPRADMLRAASINIIEEDMSNSVIFTSEEKDSRTIEGYSYYIRDGLAQRLGTLSKNAQEVLLHYHNKVSQTVSTGATKAGESLTVSFPAGLTVGNYTPENGLSSVSFSLSPSGAQITMNFRSLPKKLPSKDTILRQVKAITRHYRN
jgi:hypothetical protein